MQTNVDFITQLHRKTQRDYKGRVLEHDKAECSQVACEYGYDYWDGDRKYGYGGFVYDGRYEVVARQMIDHYGLKPGMRVLDVGCGKGFLLYEFQKALPGLELYGLDYSDYALKHVPEGLNANLQLGRADSLPYDDQQFDLVISIMTLHNLKIFELHKALAEINRVGQGAGYLVVESYRNEREKANLLYWQLTCKSFYDVSEWAWIYEQAGYQGDYSFIFFE